MVMAEEFVRQSQLLDQLVLDRATMDECGRIEVMWSYPKVHRVLGFICKAGRFDRTKLAFNLDQIDKIGENGVLVTSAPVETDRDRVQQLETLIGCEVWTDEGKRVGRISDYVFHLESGNIRYYLLGSGGLQGLTGKLYSLYPSQILGYGRGRVMVSAGIAEGLELYQVGIDRKIEQKFTGLEERIESKIKRTADRFNERLNDEQLNQTLQSGVKSWVDRARSVTSEVTAKVKDRAQEFLDDGLIDDSRSRPMTEVDPTDFDFEAWDDEPKRGDRSESRPQPRRQSFDEWSDEWLDDRVNDRVNDRTTDRSTQSQTDRTTDRTTDRPPLPNLTPKPASSTGFTAQPRPLDAKPREEPGRDAWDDDWV
jgi:uncharacterized protein YrrD